MSDSTLFLLAATVLAGSAITLYWYGQQSRLPWYSKILVVCGLALVGGSVLLDRPPLSYVRQATPVAIAIAFDLSPSMLAIPDPLVHPDTDPRYARARETLLGVFKVLEEQHENIIVSLVGFTKDADMLMGWDYSVVQLREILQLGLSPDLFTSSGTSIEAAVEKIVDVFSMLPLDLMESSRKIALIVSDGEDKAAGESLGYALAELSLQPFDVIALQAGLLGTPEGVPRYDQAGEFLGFVMMSGNIHSTPDFETMNAIARASPQRGLHVRAEEPDAIDQILNFILEKQSANQEIPKQLFVTLSILGIVVLVCARVLQ